MTRPAQAQAVGDRDVLVALYDATDGDNWTNNTNWLSDKPLREWYGVSTDGRGRVWQLNLASNNLKGDLPPELGGLANLTWLGLSDNQLTGGIPPDLGGLSDLTSLGLHTNQLTGEIPPQLGKLSNLTWLGLSANQLTGEIPPELGSLSNLTDLNLSSNQLSGEMPPQLGGLSNLTYLNLSSNQLTGGIPPALGGLSALTSLGLYNNQLSGEIPPELGGLASLTWLELSDNQLTGEIPPELGGLSALTSLGLYNNQLSGEIPPELGGLASLTWLGLYNNQLSGEIPPELGGLASLTWLGLSGNQLTGEIPPELGSLSNLTDLNLSSNQLSGEIPPELGGLASLTWLGLSGNRLVACLPDALHVLRSVPDTDVDRLPDCGGGGQEVILTVNDDPLLYNNNVFVLPASHEFRAGPLPLPVYARKFFRYFQDMFDFMFVVHNLHGFSYRIEDYNFTNQGIYEGQQYAGRFHRARNYIRGIGLHIGQSGEWGSSGKLQGVNETIVLDNLVGHLALHEIAHRWANYVIPMEGAIGAHWGFSSANGRLGGFDPADLVDHGDGRYSVGPSSPLEGPPVPKPYSPIELYLAGLLPPEEVPDLWVAEDGAFLDEYTEDGDRLFTASTIKTYTIEDIISEHGRRVPAHSRSQRDFRAALILLIDEEHPLHKWELELASRNIAQFSHAGPDELEEYNFYEATGGRATMAMGDLSRFLKDSGSASAPGAPRDALVAADGARRGIGLSWREPASAGGLTVTSYDLRYRATSDGDPAGSDWTVVEDIWTIGGGDLQHTLTGLAGGGLYDVQARAVNGAGAGPWSDTATGTPPAPWAHCLRGDITQAFSLVVYEGGAVEELAACAESREVAALYALHDGDYVLYVPGAPDIVNQRFAELYAEGVPPLTALVAASGGAPSEDPVGEVVVPQPWPQCLSGDVAEGFSLVVYGGGSVEELASCVQSLNVTAVHTLAEGEWVSYTVGGTEGINRPFRELFPDGLPSITPLVAKSEEASGASSGDDGN